MGNLCGRASKDEPDDAFAQPGRTLGSAPPPSSNPRAAVPKIASTGGGRTLGSSSSGQGEGDIDARQAAAKAAEDRAAKASQQPKGKLGRDLAKEKAQTRNGALSSVSRDERRRRDADEGAEARNWN